MKRIYHIDHLVGLGAALDEYESLPCVLVAPELLDFSISNSEMTIKEEEAHHLNAIEFLPEPILKQQRLRGVERITDISTGKVHYSSILDGHIACGVTRVSTQEFEAARIRLDRESLGTIEISQFSDGDLVRLFAHQTSGGPGVVINVLTARIFPEVRPPYVTLNPFGIHGWQYLCSLFETAAFFWAITDGDRAFLLSSVQHYYPDLVAKVHQRCLALSSVAEQRNWPQAQTEIRQQLRL